MQSLRLAPETKAHSVESIDVGQNTIGGEIRRLAELQPDHAAVVASGFAPLSYRELQKLIDEVRVALRLAGFGRNARIAISMRDGPQAALAIVAVACSAVSIPLNPRQTLTEIETCLSALRLDAMLVVKGANSAARGAAERKSLTVSLRLFLRTRAPSVLASPDHKPASPQHQVKSQIRTRPLSYSKLQGRPPMNQSWSLTAIATCWSLRP